MPVWNTANNIKRGSSQVIKMLRGGNSPWAAYNAATGGTVTDVANYNGTGETWRVHTFTSSGTLTVTQAVGVYPFRVLVVGAGGRGGIQYATTPGGGGNGGYGATDDAATIPVGSHAVTVGTDSSRTSSIGSLYSANGGSNGLNAAGNGVSAKPPGVSNGPTSDISGQSVAYGRGGPQGSPSPAPVPTPNTGNGGRGGWDNGSTFVSRHVGATGVAIVAYRIA